jgi:predicted aspartyl protease
LIIGRVSEDGVPVITLEVEGEDWPAIIDTGFNGDLELPKALRGKLNDQPAGRLIAVTNRQPQATEVTVTVDLKALGLEGKAVTAIDERMARPLDLKDGAFTVLVQGRNYTLVSLTIETENR